MDPSVPKRHVSRLYAEAAKISPAGGVNWKARAGPKSDLVHKPNSNWKAFTVASTGIGLFEDCFQASTDEASRKEEAKVRDMVKHAITASWEESMEAAVLSVMRYLDMTGRPNDSASLMVLAERRNMLTQRLGTDCPGFVLNAAYQNLVLAALKAAMEINFPAPHTYPGTYDQVDTFRVEVKSLAAFLQNSIKGASEYSAKRGR